MPYSDEKEQAAYLKGYFAGYKKATIDHLGSKCAKCGARAQLEIDHIRPLRRRSRQLRDLKDLSKLQILCNKCNGDKGDRETKPFS